MEHSRELPQPGIETRTLDVPDGLRPYVRSLVAAEVHGSGPLPLAVAPHEWLTLSVQLGRDADCIEQKGEHGQNTALTGIRRWTGSFTGAGDCVSLFALLTPLGCVQLLDSRPLDRTPRIRARVAELLDRQLTRALESDIALAPTLDAKLHTFAAWLEARACRQRRLERAALRAARAAMRVCVEPSIGTEALAAEHHVSRRQLERDFARWIGAAPHHLAQVARVQRVSSRAQSGAPLADIAADVGFADQAHMCRAVRDLTGLTPRQFARPPRGPLAQAFRRATQGCTVYL